MTAVRYRVRVLYREPTYELAQDLARLPYSWSCEVDAQSPVSAEAQALGVFRQWESLSSVGWVREVVKTLVEVLA